jgi:hypothetical protein
MLNAKALSHASSAADLSGAVLSQDPVDQHDVQIFENIQNFLDRGIENAE